MEAQSLLLLTLYLHGKFLRLLTGPTNLQRASRTSSTHMELLAIERSILVSYYRQAHRPSTRLENYVPTYIVMSQHRQHN